MSLVRACFSIIFMMVLVISFAACGGSDSVSKSSYLVTQKSGYVEISRYNADSGGRTLVNVTDPPAGTSLTAISARVRVTQYSATGTEPNGRIRGYFYNDGSAGATPGSAVGDIVGGTMITDSRVFYVIARCGDSSCIDSTTLYTATMGTVNIDEDHILSVVWDNTNHTFSFQMDSNTPIIIDPTGLAPVVSYPANLPTAGFGIRINASSGQSGSMTARFDDFYLNQTLLYDDFSGSTLDLNKWNVYSHN